jgi:hypothetical protein
MIRSASHARLKADAVSPRLDSCAMKKQIAITTVEAHASSAIMKASSLVALGMDRTRLANPAIHPTMVQKRATGTNSVPGIV